MKKHLSDILSEATDDITVDDIVKPELKRLNFVWDRAVPEPRDNAVNVYFTSKYEATPYLKFVEKKDSYVIYGFLGINRIDMQTVKRSSDSSKENRDMEIAVRKILDKIKDYYRPF
jgi:hypothetical protein